MHFQTEEIFNTVGKIIIAISLVTSFDLLEERRTDEVNGFFFFSLFNIKQRFRVAVGRLA